MRGIFAIMLSAVMVLGASAPVGDGAVKPQCEKRDAPVTRIEWIKKEYGGYELSRSVLCCCQNSLGKTCCAYVSFCGGFVPGCFCS